MRRFAVSLVALTLLSTGLAVGTGGRAAWACSCAVIEQAEYAEIADVVFAGTLTRIDIPDGEPRSSIDPATFVFAVDTVFQGSATEIQNVVTASDSASCGLEGLSPGGEFVVYATSDPSGGPAGQPGDLYSNLCSGTGPWDGSTVPAGLSGPGSPPTPAAAPTTDPSPPTVPTTPAAPPSAPSTSSPEGTGPAGDDGWSTNDWLLAAVIAMPLVASFGLAVTLAVRRRRR